MKLTDSRSTTIFSVCGSLPGTIIESCRTEGFERRKDKEIEGKVWIVCLLERKEETSMSDTH